MVKPRPDEALNEGGGSYLSIEKVMKKKKKRKSSPPEDETTNMVASNADPSLMVRVPHDKRVNVDGVLDKNLLLEVEKWSEVASSITGKASCHSPAGNVGGVVAPQTANIVASCSKPNADSHVAGNGRTQVVSNCAPVSPDTRLQNGICLIDGSLNAPQTVNNLLIPPQSVRYFFRRYAEGPLAGLSLVFKAGGSGLSSKAKATGLGVKGSKSAGTVVHRATMAKLNSSGVGLGNAPGSIRSNPSTSIPVRPGTDNPRAASAGPPKGAQVRPTFSDVIKDNRIVSNGFKLEHYDLMENEDDVILDESDEIPFVETWGYCLIGCFTGPFPGRQALNSLVNSWNVKCRIIPYAKGWTVFRFMSDEDRFKVFNGGPYLAFGKALMLRLVDAGVILGDDLFTSVPTWVLFHYVPLSVWSESGLNKIASKVGIPMYTDKFTKERIKMSYARCLVDVDVDVSKPPVMEFGVKLSGGRRYTQKVTYECYPDYCCDCKKFGHNIFKCPKKVKAVETPVVPSPVVPTADPVSTENPVPSESPVPVVNPKPVLPPKVFRPKTRVKTKNNASTKASLSELGNNIANNTLSMENESVNMVISPSNKRNGSKKMDKGKAIASIIPMVSQNTFEALNNMGGTSGAHDEDILNVQMGDLIPSALGNADHEGGAWHHVTRKGGSNGRGGVVSSSISQCGY
ncbi:hypothetical protein LIER_29550 [Lithospermum erythrorhizon]|uniref:DUF4283 domain-containing protein n=1 Tax=Lithospermum erythrorhizon TaxID=34254 RepID=A0AAV3RLA4_LITER